MACTCCKCPEGQCGCLKIQNVLGISLLAHTPCLAAIVLSTLGLGTAFAGSIHKFVPLFFLISIGCIVWSLSRWKKTNRMNRFVMVAVSIAVLVLWYPHRHHIFPWMGHKPAMEHMDHHSMPM